MPTEIRARIGQDRYKTTLTNGRREMVADEPIADGGTDLGFSPSELLCSALAACTSATLRMYADRKGWDLQAVDVKIEFDWDAEKKSTHIRRELKLTGNLDDEQRARLHDIANKCPIHRTLTHPIHIQTELLP